LATSYVVIMRARKHCVTRHIHSNNVETQHYALQCWHETPAKLPLKLDDDCTCPRDWPGSGPNRPTSHAGVSSLHRMMPLAYDRQCSWVSNGVTGYTCLKRQ
jgi:hypothetical protein